LNFLQTFPLEKVIEKIPTSKGRIYIKAWEGELIAEIYIEDGTNPSPTYRPPHQNSRRLEELDALMSMAMEDHARLKIEDRAMNKAARVK
jgi:hypothetical protein